jgi:hypothetical protein
MRRSGVVSVVDTSVADRRHQLTAVARPVLPTCAGTVTRDSYPQSQQHKR